MKKFMFMAIVATLMPRCSSNDENECSPATDEPPTEIKLNAGIFDIKTRAPVNTGQPITAKFVASSTTSDYSSNLWNATGSFTPSTTASAPFSITLPTVPRSTLKDIILSVH